MNEWNQECNKQTNGVDETKTCYKRDLVNNKI